MVIWLLSSFDFTKKRLKHENDKISQFWSLLSRDLFSLEAEIRFSIYKVFRAYISEFVIFFHEIFINCKILWRSCHWHQNFEYKYSGCPGNEAQSPNFSRFLAILTFFKMSIFAQVFNLGSWFVYAKIAQPCTYMCSKGFTKCIMSRARN